MIGILVDIRLALAFNS